jgi:hypothetical protein
VWRRWVLAVSFALASAVAAGAGYAWWTGPYATELTDLRERVKLADAIAARLAAVTPTERRQYDVLMGYTTPGR